MVCACGNKYNRLQKSGPETGNYINKTILFPKKGFHDGKEMHTLQHKYMLCKEKGFPGISDNECNWHNTLSAVDTFLITTLCLYFLTGFQGTEPKLTSC